MNGSMVSNSDRLKNITKEQLKPWKLEFTDLPYGMLFFRGWPGILDPSSCMDIKWNTTLNDIKTHLKITFILATALLLHSKVVCLSFSVISKTTTS